MERRVSCLDIITTHESPASTASGKPPDRRPRKTRLVCANLHIASFRALIHGFRRKMIHFRLGRFHITSIYEIHYSVGGTFSLSYRLFRVIRPPGTPGGCTWGTSCGRAWAGRGSPSWDRRQGPRHPATRCCTRSGTPCSAAAP